MSLWTGMMPNANKMVTVWRLGPSVRLLALLLGTWRHRALPRFFKTLKKSFIQLRPYNSTQKRHATSDRTFLVPHQLRHVH